MSRAVERRTTDVVWEMSQPSHSGHQRVVEYRLVIKIMTLIIICDCDLNKSRRRDFVFVCRHETR